MVLKDNIAYGLYANIDRTRKLIEDKQKEIDSKTKDWQDYSSKMLVAKSDRDRALKSGNYGDFFKNVFKISNLKRQASESEQEMEALMSETENLITDHKNYARGLLKYLHDNVPKHSEECQKVVFLNRAMATV